MDRANSELDEPEDVYAIRQAVALDGLSFSLLDGDQAKRIAQVLARAADKPRWDLEAADNKDQRDAEFAEYLAVLEMRLHDVYE